MRISLVISSLGSGGAERVLAGMANHLQKQGHYISLITYLGEVADFYTLDCAIERIRLDLATNKTGYIHALQSVYKRIYQLRTAIIASRPDIVISFIDRCNVLCLLACLGTSIPVIVSERTNPIYYPIGRVWDILRRILYKKARYVVIQTQALQAWALNYTTSDKIAIIPNALDTSRLQQIQALLNVDQLNPKPNIVAMGRFTTEKGHDLLLQACRPVLERYPKWHLELIGEGPLKPVLIDLAESLNIKDQVIFHGQVKNPFPLIKAADIFVLPSRIEGFPNALLEAMALGKACISFNCPSGPADLIEDGKNGLLVAAENVSALTQAIAQMVESSMLRQALGDQAKNVCHRYDEEKVMAMWEQLINT